MAGAECDTWYEPLTEWHFDWQNIVRDEFCEYIIRPHRADILGNDNCIIELQNSSIDPEVISEREQFYDNMIWLWNGEKIVKNINTDPTSKCYSTIEGRFINWKDFFNRYLSKVIKPEYGEFIIPKFIRESPIDNIKRTDTIILYNWCYANKRMMFIKKPLYIHFPDGRLFEVIKIRGPYDLSKSSMDKISPFDNLRKGFGRLITRYEGPLNLDKLSQKDRQDILDIERSLELSSQHRRTKPYH